MFSEHKLVRYKVYVCFYLSLNWIPGLGGWDVRISICMSVCMCAYMHRVCMYVCICACMHVCMHVHMFVRIYVCL